MKLFNLLFIWFSVLFVEVLSDNNSIGYELLYYYYVYKMEIASGVTRTIGVGCMPKDGGNMCYFDEFVKHLIGWESYNPAGTDHTKTPDVSVLKQLNNGMPASARYKLMALSTAFHGTTSMPEVLSTILHAANTALDAGNVNNDDLKQSVAMSQAAKTARASALFNEQVTEFANKVVAGAQPYLETFNSEFKWDDMLGNIDKDVQSGKITQAQGDQYKASINDFSANFGTEASGAKASTIMHVSVMREFSTTIDELGDQVEESSSSSEGSSPRAPSNKCDSDFDPFGSDSGSDKRKRMLAKLGSGVGKRKPMLAPIASSGNTGMRALRFGSKL
jgi:hypothetical protein